MCLILDSNIYKSTGKYVELLQGKIRKTIRDDRTKALRSQTAIKAQDNKFGAKLYLPQGTFQFDKSASFWFPGLTRSHQLPPPGIIIKRRSICKFKILFISKDSRFHKTTGRSQVRKQGNHRSTEFSHHIFFPPHSTFQTFAQWGLKTGLMRL